MWSKSEFRRGAHNLTMLEYHMVFITKYRHKVMKGDIQQFVDKNIREIAEQLKLEVKRLHVDIDHVHFLFTAPPDITISKIANRIKGATSRNVRVNFPELATRNHSVSSFWATGYFCTTVGEDAETRIQKYINHHTGY